MREAGFVLAGGHSSRMGRDKALLRQLGVPLVVRAAAAVAQVVGSVTILGDPDVYGHFGWPTIADEEPGLGPIGGLLTALGHTRAEWNLLVACDMPDLAPPLLRELIRKTARNRKRCIAPVVDGEFEPLCAIYRRSALPEVRAAIDAGHLKMRDLLTSLDAAPVTGLDPSGFRNVNTLEEWDRYLHRR
ncbi:MAG TPA: molybdenum cofactor guanylyltransferase [Bryobacteraceae bacterium]|nr:molybdenum cofactor guanylyltransferase [Bryobacteraceae bacterium]